MSGLTDEALEEAFGAEAQHGAESSGQLPHDLARRLGAEPSRPGEPQIQPDLMIDWALRFYAKQGLHIFPAGDYTGTMLIEHWYKAATTKADVIANWWTQWPEADIACVPAKSGHFVIMAVGDEGQESLDDLEEKYGKLKPAFVFRKQDTVQLWFTGTAFSSSHKLGRNLFVFGPGRYLFLPPSSSRVPQEYAE